MLLLFIFDAGFSTLSKECAKLSPGQDSDGSVLSNGGRKRGGGSNRILEKIHSEELHSLYTPHQVL